MLTLVLLLIPVLIANYVFYSSKDAYERLESLTATINLVRQIERLGDTIDVDALKDAPVESFREDAQESIEELEEKRYRKILYANEQLDIRARNIDVMDNFLAEYSSEIKVIHDNLQRQKVFSEFFFVGSFVFIIFSVLMVSMYVSQLSSAFKDVFLKLRYFQNEDKESDSLDMLECAIHFDNFLSTAKSILHETYSIAQELSRQIDPIIDSKSFSQDNVKHFFTDVQEISRSSNYISNTLDSTTLHIKDVSDSAQTIADKSEEAARDSSEASLIATEGKSAVNETIENMEAIKDEVLDLEDVIDNLNSAGKQISEIVNTITNIAYQTNLLALNAAIEAARAGEHGHGFTVVAGEVRKLAEESGEAAEDIGKKIKQMLIKTSRAVEVINRGSEKVMTGVKVANVAGNNLDKIVSSVNGVNGMIQEISNASSEQSKNIESLKGSIESISGATKITSEGTVRVAEAVNHQLEHIKQYMTVTKEIKTLVQLMSEMLDKFNLN